MLSAITISGSKLDSYLDKYPYVLESISEFTGISRSNALIIFNKSHFESKTIGVDTSPYRFVVHREEQNSINMYFDAVLDLLMHTDISTKLGLTFTDLMSMDNASFRIISDRFSKSKIKEEDTINNILQESK